jgi:ribosomal protein S18 acetylase RimI-like enzyme
MIAKPAHLPDGFHSRPATKTDTEAIARLLNARSMDVLGTRAADPARLHMPTDTQVTCTPDDEIVGYVHLSSNALYVSSEVQGAVHPDYRGRGIGAYLLNWAEGRARQLLGKAPAGTRVVIHSNNVFSTNYPARDLFVWQGYGLARHFIHLKTEMTERPPEPVWPDEVRVEVLQPGHWPKLGPAMDEAFEDHWGVVSDVALAEMGLQPATAEESESEEDLRNDEDKLYFNTPGLCFVALDGDEVAGSCLCNAKTVEFPDTGYLGSLSIRRPWRRRGLGLALTYHALGEFYGRGITRVHTDTDANSFTNAPRLYLKAGFRTFRQEDIYEKELLPGVDLLRRFPDPDQ